MKIVIIGSGNVATVFGKLIKTAQHQILQVYSRKLPHATQLATELDCNATDDWKAIIPEAEMYLIAVSDDAIPEAAKMLGKKKGLVLHTAGSVTKEVLSMCSANYGVIYPLQSLIREKSAYLNIPLLVDGNTADDLCLTEDFANSISGSVTKAGDACRMKWHLAAVIVNNFTNHLYNLAARFCEKEQVSFDLLKPLIKETAMRMDHFDPAQVQTGPAARNDASTIERHLQLLAGHRELKLLYQVMTKSIQGEEIG